MIETLFILLIFGLVFGISLWRRARQKPDDFTPPETAPSDARTYGAYERVPSLFENPSELGFFNAMRRALPEGFYIHSKTRLEDIVRVKGFIKGEGRWKLRARVKSRHVDFLITDAEGVPHIAIELDGKSHNQKAQNADSLKDGIFEATGLLLVRVKTDDNFAANAQALVKELTGEEL